MSVVLLGSTSGSITLQEPAVAGTNTVNFGANTGVAILDANTPAFRNRIINGAMVIDQRNAGASVTADGAYAVDDRWQAFVSQASKVTIQQNAGSVTPPAGFKSYLGVTVGASANVTVGASDYFFIQQAIEGYNTADFGFGAAGAATITFSFWVRSSVTGTYGGVLYNGGGSRSYPYSYVINSANTWEQKTVTVVGDTTGTWQTTTSAGLQLTFSLGTGSTYNGTAGSWVGANYYGTTGAATPITTNSATFYITGVQLEKGSTATSFDYRTYGTELALCYRYFQKFLGSSTYEALPSYVIASSSTAAEGFLAYKTTMRSTPSIAISTLCLLDGVGLFSMSGASVTAGGTDSMRISYSGLTSLTQYRSYYVTANGSTSAFLTLSSEL